MAVNNACFAITLFLIITIESYAFHIGGASVPHHRYAGPESTKIRQWRGGPRRSLPEESPAFVATPLIAVKTAFATVSPPNITGSSDEISPSLAPSSRSSQEPHQSSSPLYLAKDSETSSSSYLTSISEVCDGSKSSKEDCGTAYLDAISEVCDESKPVDDCGAVITNYLDALSTGAAQRASTRRQQAGGGITSYLDTLAPSPNVIQTNRPITNRYVPASAPLASTTASVPTSVSTAPATIQSSFPEDVALESWYRRHGIAAAGRVRVRTTYESVGGRGTFWSSEEKAAAGDILARIPKKCVLAASCSREQWPENMEWDRISDPNLKMVASAMCAYTHGGDTEDDVDWHEWIDSWLGHGGIVPRPLSSYSPEEIKSLAHDAGTSFAEASLAIEVRYNIFKQDAATLGFSLIEGSEGLIPEKFADMYCVVASRCANLGPQWEYERGIIPLHDMHNHPPPGIEPNVDLHALGDVKLYMPEVEDSVHQLLQTSGIIDTSPPLDDRDILLVARRDIVPGEEMFLSYSRGLSDSDDLTGQERLWLLFQYGFPIVTSPIPAEAAYS
mmetsp:Transcript_25581/g.55949  ORF Transcript_25581/g.55949 Transcript_25581/m.55949 type:complete len:560 (+) Transcript_25581:244-1923(+)